MFYDNCLKWQSTSMKAIQTMQKTLKDKLIMSAIKAFNQKQKKIKYAFDL